MGCCSHAFKSDRYCVAATAVKTRIQNKYIGETYRAERVKKNVGVPLRRSGGAGFYFCSFSISSSRRALDDQKHKRGFRGETLDLSKRSDVFSPEEIGTKNPVTTAITGVHSGALVAYSSVQSVVYYIRTCGGDGRPRASDVIHFGRRWHRCPPTLRVGLVRGRGKGFRVLRTYPSSRAHKRSRPGHDFLERNSNRSRVVTRENVAAVATATPSTHDFVALKESVFNVPCISRNLIRLKPW